MTKSEFRKAAMQSGYASSSKVVTEFFKKYPKKEYTSDDFMNLYHMDNPYSSISRTTKKSNY